MKKKAIPDRKKFKTVNDFLRWLYNRKVELKRVAEEEAARAAHHSAMRWADDGGRVVEPPPDTKQTPAGG